MDQTFDSNDDTTVQNDEEQSVYDYYDVNDIKGESKDPKLKIRHMEIVVGIKTLNVYYCSK